MCLTSPPPHTHTITIEITVQCGLLPLNVCLEEGKKKGGKKKGGEKTKREESYSEWDIVGFDWG